jgi:hypothetical protein
MTRATRKAKKLSKVRVRKRFTVTYMSKEYGIIRGDKTERVPAKKTVEKFTTLERARARVTQMNAWADILDLPDTSLDHIVVRDWGRKIYEQGTPDE